MTKRSSMLLITTNWSEVKSFRLMPIEESCPFVECIFDASHKLLVVISKVKKETFHMLAKLDEQGDAAKLKSPRKNGKPFPEERKSMETFQEYYIEDKKEIEEFITMFAENADTFDYKSFLEKDITIPEQPKIQLINP